MTRAFYVTTPIYYVNDAPHLGHAYTTLVADTLARFHHMLGDDTRLLTGTDEHGQKIQEAADKRGLTPQQLVDDVAPRFLAAWNTLGLRCDNDANDVAGDAATATDGFTREFIRTTFPRHKQVVQALWRRIVERNPDDLYLGTYEGWYCVACENFYTETQLAKNAAGEAVCPIHERPVQWVTKETSFFFRLSAYGDRLAEHIERHPHFVQPEQYRNEVLSFLRGGLRDLSVSRTSFSWGIPVPDDARYPEENGRHVMYVWFDALTNYLSALGDPFATPPAPAVERYWRQAIHVIGKDILRFHAVYWPSFLLAAGLPLPRTILCHGWWTIGGRKISKSIPATRVSATELAADLVPARPDLGTDALRYFLLRETPLGNDGDLIYENLIDRTNADLAKGVGNLANRALTMLSRSGNGGIGARDATLAASGPHLTFERGAIAAVRDARAAFEALAPSRALEAIWRLVREGDRYVDATQPWSLAKDPAQRHLLDHVLHTLAGALWWLRLVLVPVLPAAAAELDRLLGAGAREADVRWPAADTFGDDLPAMSPQAPAPLFPLIDAKRAAELLDKWLPAEAAAAASGAAAASASATGEASASAAPPFTPAPLLPTVTYDDFAKLDLRVGLVVAAQPVPKAKKLLQLTVDLGEPEPRTIVAGIAAAISAEAMVGRQVIVVANLAPATIRGVTSQGMILAAGDDAIVGLGGVQALPGSAVAPGARLK
jgi:methionyl-tRNA synthetase